MSLWLVRHAQPLVASGLCYGRLDVPVDAAATRAAAQALAAALPPGACMLSSPLQRCEQLAQEVRVLRPDVACSTDMRLAEMDFGTWEGQTWEALGAQALDAWTRDFAHHRPGGGESVNEVMQRVAEVLEATGTAENDVVWITHAGVIRAAGLLLSGQRHLQHAHQWPQNSLPFGTWQTVEVPGDSHFNT